MTRCKKIYEQITIFGETDLVCCDLGATAVKFCKGNPSRCPSSTIRDEMRRRKENE